MSLAFFQAERSLALMTFLAQNCLEQIYQALKNQYAFRVLLVPPKKFNLVQSHIPFFPVVIWCKSTSVQISDHLDQIYL